MICITGGTVHTGKGEVLENTDILIDNGKIVEVGKDLKGKAKPIYDFSLPWEPLETTTRSTTPYRGEIIRPKAIKRTLRRRSASTAASI